MDTIWKNVSIRTLQILLTILLLLPKIWTVNQDNFRMEAFKVEPFSNHQGIYYKSHGSVKMTQLSWDLIAYVDLAVYTSKYQLIMTQYNSTSQICEKMIQNFGSVEIENTCQQFLKEFSQATLPYLYEIEVNHRNIMATIGSHSIEEKRVSRGLGRTFRRLASVLYGVSSKIDIQSIFDKILSLAKSRVDNINFIQEKTRVIRLEAEKTNKNLQNLDNHEQKFQENLQYLRKQTKEIIQNINKITFRTKLLEQVVLFEIILNQYEYETQNLLSIVNLAMNGKMHTSIFTPERLVSELKEIKMNLPVGSALPLETNTDMLAEFFKISDITVFYRDNYLVFAIEFPLVSIEEFTVFQPIPLPIPTTNNNLFLISPDIDYLALSSDGERFFTLMHNQWGECRKLATFKICKGIQPLHHRAKSDLCEIQLLKNKQNLPRSCQLKFISVTSPIWHRLSLTNSWLFFTQPEVSTIICTNPANSFNVELSGVGRLSISPNCEVHTDNFIFFPLRNNTNENIVLDLIPENVGYELKSDYSLKEVLNHVNPQNLSNKQSLIDLISLARSSTELNKLQQITYEPSFLMKINIQVSIMYICNIIIVTIVIVSVTIKYKRKNNVKLYNPDIAEVEATDNL